MIDAIVTATVGIRGHGGDEVPAYVARPDDDAPHPVVVVLHHRDGWDRESKEIARRFATEGYVCILPHLHHRWAPGQAPEVAATLSWDAGGVPNDQLLGDVEGALAYLDEQPYAAPRRGIIGYCSGGRQSFLASTQIPFDATVVCYGPRIAASAGGAPSPLDHAEGLVGPVLGLFGDDDALIPADDVAAIGAELTRLGKPHRLVGYPDAGHAFFAVNLPAYRWQAANEGWAETERWFGEHLQGA